jgi:hypothetical protein
MIEQNVENIEKVLPLLINLDLIIYIEIYCNPFKIKSSALGAASLDQGKFM